MGVPVIIYGKSGSGKTRSLKNFDEDEIFYVNVERKLLPFRKKFRYTAKTEDINKIKEQLSKMPTRIAVIDDSTYLMINKFMKKHGEGMKGNAVYDLYNQIADSIWQIFEHIKNNLPEDVIVYVIMHEDSNDYGEIRIRTIGKLLDNKVMPEGIVTICIRCLSKEGRHFFSTETDGNDITKTPEEMFEQPEIPNDLKFVDNAIREYYGFTKPNNPE